MDGFNLSVMVALLPTTSYWCKLDLPHLTLAYAGEIPDLKLTDRNELTKSAIAVALSSESVTTKVLHPAVFGDPGEEVDVLLIDPTAELLALQSIFSSWSVSKHSFNPHVTVGPKGSLGTNLPEEVSFDHICVVWGNDMTKYRLL